MTTPFIIIWLILVIALLVYVLVQDYRQHKKELQEQREYKKAVKQLKGLVL